MLNKHMSSLKFVLKAWCDKHSDQRGTPFDSEFIPKKEVAADTRVFRVALSDEDLQQLFRSPRFTGHGDDPLRATAGSYLTKDAQYWVPLIAIHHGMRLEETLQLRPSDIETVDGVTVITVGRTPDIRVKTEFSRRRIPLHPVMVRLGFMDYVKTARGRGSKVLFPEVAPGGPDRRLGYYYTKAFTEYRRAIGFYRPGADFHALRHTLATRLFNTDADTSIVAAILGHVQQGVTAGVYLSGY